MSVSTDETPVDARVHLHLRLGWIWLAVFIAAGLALEAMHGLKLGAYLDVAQAPRRHMWTLAHAHGTLVGLVHLGLAATLRVAPASAARLRLASRCLIAAGVLLPLGFFLGGAWTLGGDPGLGVLLVPPGGLLLLAAALRVARELTVVPS
jgi:hypothetical protein